MTMEPRKTAIMAALDKFVAQRPGLEFGNYGDISAYRSEMRSITRDRHDYNVLARAVERSDSITTDMLLKASESAFSGRLCLVPAGRWFVDYADGSTYNACDEADARDHWSRCAGRNERGDGTLRGDVSYAIDYTTGQYFPTEYRKAACAVLASALWDNMIDAVPGEGEGVKSAGDWLRAYFRREFGRGIASRWFS